MSDIATKLDEARALIEKGWARGEFKRRQCFCSLGAIAKVTTGEHNPDTELFIPTREYRLATEKLAAAVGIRSADIADWNDDQPSKKPVIEAFRKAAELARGTEPPAEQSALNMGDQA